jgi:hypothetical protein
MLAVADPTPAEFLQSSKEQICPPRVMDNMPRVSHPLRVPRAVAVLQQVLMNLCNLPYGASFGTVIDKAARVVTETLLARKRDAATAVHRSIMWHGTQTGLRVQRVRHDCGGENMGGELLHFYRERGIQREPTPGYSPECNGLAEWHNLSLVDMARPMLADSGDQPLGFAPLGKRFAADAILYANDLLNAMPAFGELVGTMPYEGCLVRRNTLGVFRRFGCLMWVLQPGKPFLPRCKFAARATRTSLEV